MDIGAVTDGLVHVSQMAVGTAFIFGLQLVFMAIPYRQTVSVYMALCSLDITFVAPVGLLCLRPKQLGASWADSQCAGFILGPPKEPAVIDDESRLWTWWWRRRWRSAQEP